MQLVGRIPLGYITRQPNLNHLPGEEYLYSNSNYTLLTVIVERVSGKSLAEFTQERIFTPLGMTQTGWRSDFREVVPHRAVAYGKSNGDYVLRMPFENTYGHAGLLTTARDLDRWNRCWIRAELGMDLLQQRRERGVLTNGDTIAYAAAVRIGEQGGKYEVNHSGATAGYRAWLSLFPEEGLSIAFLSNDATIPTTQTGKGLAAIFVGGDRPSASSRKHARSNRFSERALQGDISGRYVSAAAEARWDMVFRKDSVYAVIHPHSREYRLVPIGLDHFKNNELGEIRMVRGYGNVIMGCYVSVERARNVWFEKR